MTKYCLCVFCIFFQISHFLIPHRVSDALKNSCKKALHAVTESSIMDGDGMKMKLKGEIGAVTEAMSVAQLHMGKDMDQMMEPQVRL